MTALSKLRRPKAILLMAHAPHLDPRVGWMARSLSAMYDVCEIGMFGWNNFGMVPSIERVDAHRWRIQVDRTFHGDDVGSLIQTSDSDILQAIDFLQQLRWGQAEEGKPADSKAAATGLAKYIYDSNHALIQAASLLGAADLVVGCDFEALPAAVIVGKAFRASVIYDAHEYWPYSINGLSDFKIDFWRKLDRFYARQVDYRIAVSTQLAEAMSADYGAAFEAIPNAVPIADAPGLEGRSDDSRRTDQVTFLFQGNFAEGRGLGQLIDVWSQTDEICVLKMRGPDSPYKTSLIKRAEDSGLLGQRILFPDALPEGDLIAGAMEDDVGLIPYEPISLNNKFCCPNKLSQYMAAGIPIIANDLVYVQEQMERAGCGVSVPFSEPELLRGVIDRYAHDARLRREQGDRGRRYFETEFNWDKKVKPLLSKAASYLAERSEAAEEFQFQRILDPHAVPGVILQKLAAPWVELAEIYFQEVLKNRKAYEAWSGALSRERPGPPAARSSDAFEGQEGLSQSLWEAARKLEHDMLLGMSAADRYVVASRTLEQEIGTLRNTPTEYAAVAHAKDLATRAEFLKARLSDHLEVLEFLRGNIRILDQLRAGMAAPHTDGSGTMQELETSILLQHLDVVSNVLRGDEVDQDTMSVCSGFSTLSDENRLYLKFVRSLGELIFYRDQIEVLTQSVGLGRRYRRARDLVHIVKAALRHRWHPNEIGSRLKRIDAYRHKAEEILAGLSSTDAWGGSSSRDLAEWRSAAILADVLERRDLFQRAATELSQIAAEIFAARYGPAVLPA